METHGLPWKMVYKWWVFTWFFHAISIGPNWLKGMIDKAGMKKFWDVPYLNHQPSWVARSIEIPSPPWKTPFGPLLGLGKWSVQCRMMYPLVN
jgi:hypothetical protein